MLPGYHPRREGRAAYEAVSPAAVIAHARRLLRLRPRARLTLTLTLTLALTLTAAAAAAAAPCEARAAPDRLGG